MKPEAPIRGKRVLVVDDEPWIAEVLAEILTADGHEVETARNGALALDCLSHGSYDLIICDLRMPELDGQGLYRELKRTQPDLLRRIVFVTGSAEEPGSRDFLKKSGAPWVLKPFTISDVHRVTQDVLRLAAAR